MRMLQAILVLSCIIYQCTGYGQRSMTDETYDIILKALKGEFTVPVAERSKVQRTALIRLWRNRKHFGLSGNGKSITWDGKLVAKKSSISSVVNRGLNDTKGSGARKLKVHLRACYSGISQASVQEVLNQSTRYHLHKTSFGNKPIPKPIIAKAVHDRHQIDLVDMSRFKLKHGRTTYRYILTVIDVFSRYLWLKPLKSKHSSEVAKHLEDIYIEHGPPKIVQHDQGTEFKGAVEKLLKSLNVKTIRSSPYHPQSQGKVERSHCALRKKIMYDLVNFEKGGVNWVSHLPQYGRVMNEDPKEILNWMSPFQVYYGRKSHRISNQLASHFEVEEPCQAGQKILPSQKHRLVFENKRKRIRQRAQKATQHCIQRNALYGKHKSSIYEVNDNVLVRVRTGNHRVGQKYIITPGVVVKRNLKFDRYKIKFQMVNSSSATVRWFSVSDVTSVTRLEEKQRVKSQPKNKTKKVSKQRHLYIPFTHETRLETFQLSNLNVRFDPLPDGNCQFSAIADQLSIIGVFRSAKTLRKEIVADLTLVPNGMDGSPLSNYVEGSWEDYLQRMTQNGTHGDHITLQRASQMYNVQFLIVSTLGVDASAIISPSGIYCDDLPLLVLGHFAEGEGEHYVSLDGPTSGFVQTIQQAESHRVFSNMADIADGLADCEPLSNPESSLIPDEPGLLSHSEQSPPISPDGSGLLSHSEPSSPMRPDEPGLLSHFEPSSPISPDESGLLSHSEQSSPMTPDEPDQIVEIQSIPSSVVEHSGNEPAVPNLPPEVISKIIEFSVKNDMTMLGTFNQVSPSFSKLAAPFHPSLYIRESLVNSLGLSKDHECSISIMKLYKAAGRNSGLSLRIKELFGKNSRWMTAWLLLIHIAFGQFEVKDVYWHK